MAITYDKNTDYAKKMNEAKAKGDTKGYETAAAQRQAKIAGEGLDNSGRKIPTDIYSMSQLSTGAPPPAPKREVTVLPTPIEEDPATNYYNERLAEVEKANRLAERQAREAQQLQTQAALEENNAYIPQVNKTSDKALQEAYISSMRAKAQAPQALSAMGYTGGAAESSLLGLDATYQNQRGDIENSRAGSLDQIRQNAQKIQTTGDASLSSLAANYYNNLVSEQSNAAAAAQNQMNWQSEFEANQKAKEKSNYANTITAYSSDYASQINKVQNDGDDSNDWQVEYLRAAREQKLAEAKQQYEAIVAQYYGGEITKAQANAILSGYGMQTLA